MTRSAAVTRVNALFGALVMTIPSACGGSAADGQPAALNGEQARAEYLLETKKLQLPPGVTWVEAPPNLATEDDGGQPQYFEAGVGAQGAILQWFCSWAGVVVETKGTDTAAIGEIAKIETMPALWDNLDDAGRNSYRSMIAQAKVGNVSDLAQEIDANCPTVP